MASVTVEQTVNAPAADTWAAWDDFANINAFNPNIRASYLINGSHDTGQGAMRQCDLADGKNWIRERVTQYVPGEKMVIDIYEGSMPLKSAEAIITIAPKGPTRSTVRMTMNFVPKGGPLGALMVPMMKPQFRKMLRALLAGNAAHVEKGLRVAA